LTAAFVQSSALEIENSLKRRTIIVITYRHNILVHTLNKSQSFDLISRCIFVKALLRNFHNIFYEMRNECNRSWYIIYTCVTSQVKLLYSCTVVHLRGFLLRDKSGECVWHKWRRKLFTSPICFCLLSSLSNEEKYNKFVLACRTQ